jgi:hypothetical protein
MPSPSSSNVINRLAGRTSSNQGSSANFYGILRLLAAGEKLQMNEVNTIRPSWWYAAPGIILILVGAGLFVFFLLTGILHLTDSLTQVVVPGKAELDLKTPGKYTIFLEEQSVVNGRIYSTTESVNGLTCTVVDQPGMQKLALRKPSMSTTYSVNSRAGRSVLEFDIPQEGKYELSCGYPEDTKGPETVLAVGSGVGERIMQTVGRSLVAIFGGGVTGLVIILLVYSMRDKEKKRLKAGRPFVPGVTTPKL